MKIGEYVSPAKRAYNLQQFENAKYDEKIIVKISPKLENQERNLIASKELKKIRHSKLMVFFEADLINQRHHMEYENAFYWYRTMTREDYAYLLHQKNVRTDREKDYGGIAPNFAYCSQTKYFGNEKMGTHIIEFKLPYSGKKFLELIMELEAKNSNNKKIKLEKPKGEGGGSIGLGPSGMYKGTAGKFFNSQLDQGIITWRLVKFRIANPMPNDALYYNDNED